jgi:hypothetical protein
LKTSDNSLLCTPVAINIWMNWKWIGKILLSGGGFHSARLEGCSLDQTKWGKKHRKTTCPTSHNKSKSTKKVNLGMILCRQGSHPRCGGPALDCNTIRYHQTLF